MGTENRILVLTTKRAVAHVAPSIEFQPTVIKFHHDFHTLTGMVFVFISTPEDHRGAAVDARARGVPC